MYYSRYNYTIALLLLCLTFYGQQPQVGFINIDGCGTSDGNGEYFIVYSGESSFTANSSNIDVSYETTSITDAFDDNSSSNVSNYVANLEALLPANCINFIVTTAGDNIPAGSHILIVNGGSGTPDDIDFSGFCGANEITIYVMISTDTSWGTSGRFANDPTSNRTINSNINGNSSSYNYIGTGFSNAGITRNQAGNYLQFDENGTVNYGNYSSCNINSNEFLPVSWLSFTANHHEGVTLLKWLTANEEDNDFFTVERSIDINYWEPLGYVEGKGTTRDTNTYEYVDNLTPSGRVFYRIRQTDFNGKFDYSEVISIENKEYLRVLAYPNPTSDFITIESNDSITKVILVDSNGLQVDLKHRNDTYDLSTFQTGIYRILIKTSQSTIVKTLLIN